MTGPNAYYNDMHKGFTETLLSENLSSQNIKIILQSPEPDSMSWINAVRKLVALDCDIIVSFGASASQAVLDQTSIIPVIFAGVYDPEGLGLLSRNATGISATVPVKTVLKNLKAIKNFKTLGIVTNNQEKDTLLQLRDVMKWEDELGFRSVPLDFHNKRDLPKFNTVDALLFTTASVDPHTITGIIDLTRDLKIPSAAIIGGNADSGIILTISANPQEQGHEAANMVKEVLKGTRTSSLEVKQFTQVDFIINMKKAAELGLMISFDLLSSATELIQ